MKIVILQKMNTNSLFILLFLFVIKCIMFWFLENKQRSFFNNSISSNRLAHQTSHSMATANLKKCEDFVTNSTAASKYIPRRPRISMNWNPTFQTSLHKISKEFFFRLPKFQGTTFVQFLMYCKAKKISELSENFWNFLIFQNY